MRIAAIILGLLLLAAPARADETTVLGGITLGKNSELWEARLGAGAFDVGPLTTQVATGVVLNGEVLAPAPDFLSFIGSPRPYLGTDVALSSNAVHVFYGGLNWEAYLAPRFFLGFSGGGSVTTSRTVTDGAGAVKDLGSRVLFHLQASVGFDITPNMTAQVFYNHFSNANLGPANGGLESVGGRIGFRF